MDALTVAYAKELTRWGIETSIVVLGAFTKGTNHLRTPPVPRMQPDWPSMRTARLMGFGEQVKSAFASIVPENADAGTVAEAMVAIVNARAASDPFGLLSTRRMTVRWWSIRCSTVCVKRCCTGLVLGSAYAAHEGMNGKPQGQGGVPRCIQLRS